MVSTLFLVNIAPTFKVTANCKCPKVIFHITPPKSSLYWLLYHYLDNFNYTCKSWY